MEYVFLFSGQGSQFKGMAEDICTQYPAARTVIDKMSGISGEDIASFLWHTESEELARSDRSQLAITAMQIAITTVLQEHGITPAAAAGFSLGEFSALYAAKVLDLTTMTKLVTLRGKSCKNIAKNSMRRARQREPDAAWRRYLNCRRRKLSRC